MPSRHATAQPDLDFVVDLNCDPDITPAQHAEARKMLVAAMGPCAEPVLRAATHAAAARRELAQHRAEAARAQLRGIVTAVNDGHVRLVVGGTDRVLVRPDGVELGVGQTVLTDAEGRTVLAAGEFLLGGTTYAFCERLEGHYALVRSLRDGPHDDLRQLAVVSDAVDLGALAPGDHVLGWSIDNGNLVLVTRRLGPPRPSVADDGGMMRCVVRREDIVGMEDVIARAERLFLDAASPAFVPLLEEADPGLVGAVFQGPAGCGKSKVATLLVCQVRARGGCALYRTASHYLSKWVGEGSAIMRADFAFLDASYEKTGVRPLLVVDELEAIALDRQHGWTLNGGHLDVLDTLLSLLTRSTARMIGISNIADRFLDTALVREGRIPIVPFPPRLEPEQVAALVAKRLARVPLTRSGGAS